MLAQLAIFLLLISPARAAVDPEVSEDLQKNDWPALILLLKPKQGQNFEQDLILAKAYLSLERRTEALKTLSQLSPPKKDDRAAKLIEIASSQFFNQETATLYYEALRILSGAQTEVKVGQSPFQRNLQIATEAKERLDQALLKEPDHGLILLRIIQVDFLMGLKEPLQEHLKLAVELNPLSKELKIFQAKNLLNSEQEAEAYKILFPLKAFLYENELPFTWYLEVLAKMKKSAEITSAKNKILKEHPQWQTAIQWFQKKGLLNTQELKLLKKDADAYEKFYQAELKRTQYLWRGYLPTELPPDPTNPLLPAIPAKK